MNTYNEKRPWGDFTRFTLNQNCTVKIINVLKGEAFSLQYHNEREEFWHIISGVGKIIIGEKIVEFKPGDEFNIPKKTNHRLEAFEDVKFLEISLGEFKEEDIVRIEDKYGRN